MKKITLFATVAALVATASLAVPSAYAGPAFNKNMKFSNGGGKGGGGAWKGHHHGHGGYWGPGLGLGLGLVGAGAAYASADECFYVRRNVFVPGVGIVKRRQMVCS